MAQPRTPLRSILSALLAVTLGCTAVPVAQAAIGSSSSHSPSSPVAGDTVTLTYTKSKALLDPDQTGSVTPSYTGPTSGSLGAKSYAITGPAAGSVTLQWTLPATYAGSYTVSFTDTPTAGTRQDQQQAFTVAIDATVTTYYTGTLSDQYRFLAADMGGEIVAVGLEGDHTIRQFRLSGGTMTPSTISTYVYPRAYAFDLIDVSRDGRLDLVVGPWAGIDPRGGNNDHMKVYDYQSGLFTLAYGNSNSGGPVGAGFMAKLDSNTVTDYVTPGDFTTDGFRLAWIRDGAVAGNLDNAPWVNYETGGTNTGFALPKDYDNDGRMDILVVRTQQLGYMHNLGGTTPSFSWVPIYYFGANTYFTGAKWVDFDQDGKQDLLLSSALRTYVCYQDTTTSYACSQVGQGATDGDSADFNGDGRPDVVTMGLDPGGLEVNLNGGGRNNWQPVGIATPCCATGLKVFDLNADGKPDVLYMANGDIYGVTMSGFPPVGPNIVTGSQVYDSSGNAISGNWGTWNGPPGATVYGTNLLKAQNLGNQQGTVHLSMGAFTCSCGPTLPASTSFQLEYGFGSTPPASSSFWTSGWGSILSSNIPLSAGQTVWFRYDVSIPAIVRDGSYTASFTIA